MRAVAGGGRYDQLVGLIGGVEMPACGFAMGDMVITDLIRETEAPAAKLAAAVAEAGRVDVFVVLADPSKEPEAARVAHELRAAGLRVLSPLAPAKVAKQFQAAEQSGARHAVVVGTEFPLLTVRDLSDRSERSLPVDGIAASLG
jgi:histidyl-tRNA synthetase